MLTAVDHVAIGVADVSRAVEAYRALGFTVTDGMGAADVDHQAAHVVFGDFYLELRARGEAPLGAASGGDSGADERIHRVVVRADDLDAEVERLRSDGFQVTDLVDGPAEGRDGSTPRRTAAVNSLIPIGLIEPHPSERSNIAGGAIAHANTATVLERIYVAVESIDRELEMFEQLLGMPAPEPEMGTVIMSMMSVFYVGGVGIAIAEPRGPGPTADALNANGPGLFQALFRAEHLDGAAALMVENGLPAPQRGTRLSGESALLVEPAQACNLYVALAGQP